MTPSLNLLDDLENYKRLFTDADFFRPAVEEICRRHQLAPAARIRVGVPGTCPVFIVEERWLVKLFGRLFDGGASYAAEHAAARLMAEHARIPTPALLAAGELQPAGVDWPWPYMVFEFIPSTSLGQARAQVSQADQLRLAAEIGAWMHELHAAAIPAAGPFAQDWHAHLGLLDGQQPGCAARHAGWGGLPARLAEQIDAYLLPAAQLVLPGERPHLIHADLTEDHVLGRVVDGQWTTLALIDFGDACTGGLLYELCALHLSLFGADRRLLAAFLEAYGYSGPGGADFARRAMSCALLHEFNVLEVVPQRANLREAETLEELAEKLWCID
jgi:hypothetical protein